MNQDIDIQKLDPFIAIKPADASGVRWLLPYEEPLRLGGFAWFGTDRCYDRLPLRNRPAFCTRFPDGKATPVETSDYPVFQLSRHTAGGQLQFRTDSTRILLQGELTAPGGMDHMAYTGSGGFDLYVKEDGVNEWRMVGVSRTDHAQTAFSVQLGTTLAPKMRSILIHFPLYNGVKSLAVGIDETAHAEAPAPWRDPRPVLWYGTSIAQGGCASRPGMAGSNILSRLLERPVLNFGFSGNGKGEPEIIDMLAAIADPALAIIDYDWNVNAPEMAASLPGVLDRLRARHPGLPLVVVSHTAAATEWLADGNGQAQDFAAKIEIQRDETARRIAAGDRHIAFLDGRTLLGADGWECVVDGCHLTDLGFYRQAHGLLPEVKRFL